MIVSNCPRCGEAVRVPASELAEDAYARCPWCRETFPLISVLQNLPPLLELLAIDGTPIQPPLPIAPFAAKERDLVGSGLAEAGASLRKSLADSPLAGRDSDPAGFETIVETNASADTRSTGLETLIEDPGFDFEEALELEPRTKGGVATVIEETVTDSGWRPAPAVSPEELTPGEPEPEPDLVEFEAQDRSEAWPREQEAMPISPMRVSTAGSAKRRKHQNAGLRTAIGVVLGGLLALPLAGGILLAFGRAPDLGFWPFDGSQSSGSSRVAAPPSPSTTRLADAGPLEPRTDLEGTGLEGTGLAGSGSPQTAEAANPASAALEPIVPRAANELPSAGNDAPASDAGRLPATLPMRTDAAASLPTALSEPAPSEPAPSEPAPSEPAPSEPAPSEPSPKEPDDAAVANIESPRMVPAEAGPSAATEQPAESPPVAAPAPVASEPASDAIPPAQPRVRAAEPELTESAEMIAAAELAGTMIEAVSAIPEGDKERLRQLLATYRQVAMTCDLARGDSPPLRALATSLAASPIVTDIESLVGAEWLRSNRRNSNGVALVGQVDQQAKAIMLNSGKVVMLGGDAPLPAAGRILVLGRIVDAESVELILAQPLP